MKCCVEGCVRLAVSRGFCLGHYESFRTRGSVSETPLPVKAQCSQDGCDRELRAKGLCSAHYKRLQKGACLSDPVRTRNAGATCVVAECGELASAKQMCRAHYQVVKRYGTDALDVKQRMAAGHACEVCGKVKQRMAVDHDHATGQVRGLLCYSCNGALGMVEDDVDVLMSLASYVLTHRSVAVLNGD